jgi:hypothetical protein
MRPPIIGSISNKTSPNSNTYLPARSIGCTSAGAALPLAPATPAPLPAAAFAGLPEAPLLPLTPALALG